MNFNEQTILGKTGVKVGRLGVSSSFGAPAEAFEEAFERGCNYFTWGTFIKGKSGEMKKAIQNIVQKGQRDKLVLASYGYGHNAFLNARSVKKGLKRAGIEYLDVMLLGYHQRKPNRRIIEGALKLKEKGLIRYIGLSGHTRKLFPKLDEDGLFDVYHIRYNAANRGAEIDLFPYLRKDNRTGIVSFTATRWRQLLKQSKMPEGEQAPTASDCYRFVLSNPAVDVCMMGAKTLEQMQENLKTLESGPLSEEEMARMRKIGDYLYGRK